MAFFHQKSKAPSCPPSAEDKIAKRTEKYNEPLKEYGELLHLKHLVGTTRINRINAANRLQRTEEFLQGINIYYSCFTAVLALLGLIIENKPLSVWSTALTVILAISIVYLNAQKYGNRAQELQTNYIALHQLLFDIEKAEAQNDTTQLDAFTNKYCELLQTSENHINLDYLRQLKQKSELKGAEKVEYCFTTALRWAIKIVLIGLPIGVSIILYMQGIFVGIIW